MQIKYRDKLTDLIRPVFHNGKAVEVGVLHGKFSSQLLQDPKIKLLYSVDSWEAGKTPTADYLKAIEKLAPYKNRSVILHMSSVKAAQLLNRERFCLVYIDADHTYKGVSEDISAWWPLIQPGGILAGHDYVSRTPGVIQAVDEFMEAQKLKLFLTSEKFSSWYCFKPRQKV